MNPENSAQNFAVCDMMGVYRTDNEGLSWKLLPTDEFAGSARTRLQFSGSGVNQRLYGIRRLKWDSNRTSPAVSADGGVTWQDLDPPSSPAEAHQYYSMVVDPVSTGSGDQRIVMDNWTALWFTADGGDNWSLIYQRPTGSGPIGWGGDGTAASVRLAGVAWDGNKIYVGTNVGMFVSTNNGSSWALVAYDRFPPGGQIIEFCGAKNAGVLTLFATFVDSSPIEGWQNVIDFEVADELDNPPFDYLGLYTVKPEVTQPEWVERPGPSGIPFARVDVPANDSSQPWAVPSRNLSGASVYEGSVSTDPWTWTRTLETDWGGDNVDVSTGYQGDGGILSWGWSYPTLSIDVSDSDPDRVVVTGDFPYVTDDGGQSWMQMYVNPETENPADSEITPPNAYHHSGLGVTTGHWLHWVSVDVILAASTDIGLQRSADGGVTWTTDYTPSTSGGLDTGNWYSFAKQPGAARIYAAVASINDFYEPGRLTSDWDDFETGDVRFSDDNGQSWTSIGSGVSDTLDGHFPGPVITVAVDPANPSHVYAASASSKRDDAEYLGGIYRSTNGGTSWNKLTNPPDTEGRPLSIHVIGTDELVVTFCARQDGSGDHTESSGVFYSDDGGSTWDPRMVADMAYYTRDLVVDPGNSSRWFVAVQSTKTDTNSANPVYDGRSGVYRTDNKGIDWELMEEDHHGVQSITYVPGANPLLYMTSMNEGLWVSSNPNDSIPTFTRVTSFPFARARRVFVDPHRADGTIWVTTQGGGLWRGTVEPTMAAAVVRTGVAFDFQIDVTDTGGTAPTLYGITDLAASPGGWSVLTGLSPSTSSPASGVTRYTWATVSGHSLFTGLNGGFARAVRTRSDGTQEVSEAGGWVTEELQTGHIASWGVPWLKPVIHRAPVVTLGTTLELGIPYAGSLSGKQYYVEIEDGSAQGHRFEINESSSTTNGWVIDTSNHLNTSSTLPTLNGERVSLREHWTFGEVFPKAQFVGGSSAATSDEVSFWETTGTSSFKAYWFLNVGSLSRWVRSGDGTLADQGTRLIPPGEGAFMRARPSAANRVVPGWGLVRQQVFRHPLEIGYQMTSLGFPLTMSCGSNHQMAGDGFLATLNPATADRVQQWLGDATPGGSGYVGHWYANLSGTRWVRTGDGTLANKTWDLLFGKQRALLMEAKSTAKPDRSVSLPWAP